MEHIRQSRPDSGLGVQVKVLGISLFVPTLLGSCQDLADLGKARNVLLLGDLLHVRILAQQGPAAQPGEHVPVFPCNHIAFL